MSGASGREWRRLPTPDNSGAPRRGNVILRMPAPCKRVSDRRPPAGTECASVPTASMNAVPMIVRCAVRQSEKRYSADAVPLVRRYRVTSDGEAAPYRYLQWALAAGQDLVYAGHSGVMVQDLLAVSRQWVWEPDAAGGRWRLVFNVEVP
jgi:hypothetical protein